MRRKRLLLADDSITIQRVIELTFADEPIDVVTVGDGAAAMAELAAFPPDVVLADIGMPPPDGYELALHVHRTPALSHIPVVLLTGAFDPVDHARASEAECADILAKPFDPQMLVARVRDLVRGGSESAPAASEVVDPPPVAVAPVPGTAASVTAVTATTTAADEYFEQLDRAFARLATTEPTRDSQTSSAIGSRSGANPIEVAAEPISAPGADGGQAHAGVNAGRSELAEPVSALSVDALERRPSEAEDTQASALRARTTLGEAFATLLAVEAGRSVAIGPEGCASSTPADLIADLAARIGRETAERVVREITRDLVARVAERVLREEIARRTGQGSHC